MTALRPGQSPPPVRTPTRMSAQYPASFDRSTRVEGRETADGSPASLEEPAAVTVLRVTFSIVARSPDGESWGVAVASKFLAVGSVVPAAVAGVGAVATQALANVAYKGLVLSHLDEGATAAVALDRLLEEDDGRDNRQVGIVDCDGGSATHTGPECIPWAGGLTGPDVAIQGNILTGPE